MNFVDRYIGHVQDVRFVTSIIFTTARRAIQSISTFVREHFIDLIMQFFTVVFSLRLFSLTSSDSIRTH